MAEFEITVDEVVDAKVYLTRVIWARDEINWQQSYVRLIDYGYGVEMEIYERNVANIPALIAALQRAQEIAAQWAAESEGDDGHR